MSQACSGQLMSHNTYDNIVKNKGNIDYCIEVHFLAMILQILSPAISVSLVILRTIGLRLVRSAYRFDVVHACGKSQLRGLETANSAVSDGRPLFVFLQQFGFIENRIRCMKVMCGGGPFLA